MGVTRAHYLVLSSQPTHHHLVKCDPMLSAVIHSRGANSLANAVQPILFILVFKVTQVIIRSLGLFSYAPILEYFIPSVCLYNRNIPRDVLYHTQNVWSATGYRYAAHSTDRSLILL